VPSSSLWEQNTFERVRGSLGGSEKRGNESEERERGEEGGREGGIEEGGREERERERARPKHPPYGI
jgi:general stress protein YciG